MYAEGSKSLIVLVSGMCEAVGSSRKCGGGERGVGSDVRVLDTR